jgi:formylglycine-generating enzyme required for sulfatase activity
MIGDGLSNRTPKKLITLSAFEISRSEVTIAQYRKCVIAGVCSIPLNTTASANAGCNWTATAGAKEQHPVNCVSWVQARQYISWIDSADPNFTYALPSEAEWEYVARNISEGVDYLQPWGSATPSCNYLVFRSGSTSATNGCGTNSTATVCLKSTTEDTTGNVVRTAFNGDTLHGVCDMAGNVQEWTADFYVANYNSTPTNGSPYVGPATLTGRVVRGSSWSSASSAVLNYIRSSLVNTSRSNAIGFRVVRR